MRHTATEFILYVAKFKDHCRGAKMFPYIFRSYIDGYGSGVQRFLFTPTSEDAWRSGKGAAVVGEPNPDHVRWNRSGQKDIAHDGRHLFSRAATTQDMLEMCDARAPGADYAAFRFETYAGYEFDAKFTQHILKMVHYRNIARHDAHRATDRKRKKDDM
jgi:hypothetical protein